MGGYLPVLVGLFVSNTRNGVPLVQVPPQPVAMIDAICTPGPTCEPVGGTTPRSAPSSTRCGFNSPMVCQVAVKIVEQSPDCGETFMMHSPNSPSTGDPHGICTAQTAVPHGPVTRNVARWSASFGFRSEGKIARVPVSGTGICGPPSSERVA